MADPQEPQLLSSFTAEAIASLQEGIDPRELLVRAHEYPTLRMLLDDTDVKQKIGESLVKNDPELLRNALLGIFNEAKTYQRQEMTERPGTEPFAGEAAAATPKLTTQEYVSRIADAETASQLVIEQRKIAKRHEFAKNLTDNFVKQTRQQITEDQKQMEAKRIEDALSLGWYRNKAEIANTLRQSYFGGPAYQDVADKVATQAGAEADRVARDQERFESTIISATSSIAADEVFVQKPGVFIKIAAAQAERSNAPADRIIDRAAALENATAGFTGDGQELPLTLSPLAKTPVQKFVAGIVDTLPEGPRGVIVAGIVGNAWERAVDTATRYYGEQITNSGWFGQALAHGSQGLTNTKGALQSMAGGAQKILGDVAVTVFRGEMDEATLAYIENIRQHTAIPTMASAIFRKPAGETVVAPAERGRAVAAPGTAGPILRVPAREAAIASVKTAAGQPVTVQQYIAVMGPVRYQQFYAAAVYSHNPGLLSYGVRLGLRYGTRKISQKATQALIKAGVKKAVVSGATKLGLEVVAGAATGGWGWVAAAALNALSWLKNKTLGLFKSLVGMGTSKNPEDSLILIFTAGIALFFFFPVLPLFNTPAFNQSMIDASLATSLGAGTGAPDSTGGYVTPGGPIGSTTLSCANTSGVLLKQCDAQWGNIPFKNIARCTICGGGCGPTATTMILHAFGSSASVPDVAGRVAALDTGNMSCSSGIGANLAVMQEAGLSTAGIGLDWQEADAILENCGLIFALGNTPTSGHFVVITGINWDTAGTSVVSYNTLDPWHPYTTQDSSTFAVKAMYGVVK